MVVPQITPLRCLFVLWALTFYKCAFDLDLLRFCHQYAYTHYSVRKHRKPLMVYMQSEKLLNQMPQWVLSLASILQVVTLILMITYIVSLLFDFEELFDFSVVNKDDLPVKLTD